MTRSLLFLAPLFAIGCATPTSGDYLLEETSTTTDCPDTEEDTDADEAEAEPVAFTVSEDKSTVTIGEGDSAVELPLDGTSFEGVLADVTTDYNDEAMGGQDAITNFHMDISGQWVSSSKITGSQTVSNTCEGAYCTDLEGFGAVFCSTTFEYEGTLEE